MAATSKLKRSVAYDTSSLNLTTRTVALAASSTTPYLRSFGWEILGHDVEHIDFTRLNAPAPLLREHDTERKIGVLESYSLDSDDVLRTIVRFSEGWEGDQAMRELQEGTLGQTSIGYQPLSMRQIGEKDGIPVFLVDKWIPHEVSLVTIAADVVGAGLGRSIADESNAKDQGLMDLVTRAMATYAMEKAQAKPTPKLAKSLVTKPEDEEDKKPVEETKSAAEEEQKPVEVTADDEDELKKQKSVEDETNSAQAESTNPELERVKALESLGRALDAEELAAECIKSGATPDEFKAKVDNFKRGLSAAIHTKTKTKGKEEMSTFDQVARAAVAIAQGKEAPEAVRAKSEALRRDYSEIATKTNVKAVMTPAKEVLQRAYSVGVANEGGSTTQADFDASQIIRHLHNSDVVALLGVPTPTLYAETQIPRQTVLPGAVSWGYGESAVAAEVKNNRFDRLTVKPHRMTAYASLTTEILNDSRIDIGSLIQDDLRDQINLEKQAVLLGAGGGDVPVGLDGSGITAYTTATYANAREHILRMAASISKQNANKPRTAYKILCNESTKTSFELIKRDAGSNVFLCENDKIEGMEVVVSNAIADNVVYVGDWTQVWMPDFFTSSVHVDPNFKAGLVDFVFEFWFDVGVKRPKFFVKATFA